MDFNFPRPDAQARPGRDCPGCGKPPRRAPGPVAMLLHTGAVWEVCGPCARHAMADESFRSAMACSALTGATVPHMTEVYGRLGQPLPTTPEEVLETMARLMQMAPPVKAGGAR